MRPDLVIIPCGAAKRPNRSPAADLYTGSYFRACQKAATALRPHRGYLILSALHGLVRPTDLLDPYELRMGAPGSVETNRLRDQAKLLGVDDAQPVVAFGGSTYLTAVCLVWPEAHTPLTQLPHRGMGYQIQALARIARAGGLP